MTFISIKQLINYFQSFNYQIEDLGHVLCRVKAQKQAHLNMWKRGLPSKQIQEQRLKELEQIKKQKPLKQKLV